MSSVPVLSRHDVVRLWLERQGLDTPRGARKLTAPRLVEHLERVGGLQIDTVNVLERAHYLTLWSRFGAYDRDRLDSWIYDDRVAYEYWGHEASLLPASFLPLSRRRMLGFPSEHWTKRSWWTRYQTPDASKRRVLSKVRRDGPLESTAFESQPERKGGFTSFAADDKRSLKLLWHAGKLAIARRRHFRCVYDLYSRVLPKPAAVSRSKFEESWLEIGLSGNGVATIGHLNNYMTTPTMPIAQRRSLIQKALRSKRLREVRIEGVKETAFATPDALDELSSCGEAEGTTFVCPFDSFLWQRKRAAQLLDFDYKIEIYVPEPKREFGYYAMPILHDGRLVGRIDPKLHRDQKRLEFKAIGFEKGFKPSRRFRKELRETGEDLARFVGATTIDWPKNAFK